ncbi:MAG: hypothetical protein ACI86X_002203 [Moritella sp.]|jgi:hypothetical protein
MNYLVIWSLSLLACVFTVQADTDLESIIKLKQQSQNSAQQTQREIEDLDEQTNELVGEYRAVLRENTVLESYNIQLQKQLTQQANLLEGLAHSMANARTTRMELQPFMQDMVQVLTLFVAEDIPFLWQERQLRLQELNLLLDNPNIAVADKYRRILEAYQIETEYGDTIETWQAQLPKSTDEKTVQLIRVGRIALYYLTPDHSASGYWDNSARTWQPLPESWLPRVKQVVDVAENKILPTLLDIPLLQTQLLKTAILQTPILQTKPREIALKEAP